MMYILLIPPLLCSYSHYMTEKSICIGCDGPQFLRPLTAPFSRQEYQNGDDQLVSVTSEENTCSTPQPFITRFLACFPERWKDK